VKDFFAKGGQEHEAILGAGGKSFTVSGYQYGALAHSEC
jgi:hypothetical protein